jgi:glycine/D-amino acid oxidase-like deaminating enzyme
MRNFEVIAIGAGMVGPAIAHGLVEQGLQVAILDEGNSNLRAARMLQAWATLRILSADKFPVYAASSQYPGAFVAVTHSGVTLAAAHSQRLAPCIAGGEPPADFDAISPRRFNYSPRH